jgi:hypothetical protein
MSINKRIGAYIIVINDNEFEVKIMNFKLLKDTKVF